MKRWTLRITLCLLLGVITSVVVAWGCFIADDHQSEIDAIIADAGRRFGADPSDKQIEEIHALVTDAAEDRPKRVIVNDIEADYLELARQHGWYPATDNDDYRYKPELVEVRAFGVQRLTMSNAYEVLRRNPRPKNGFEIVKGKLVDYVSLDETRAGWPLPSLHSFRLSGINVETRTEFALPLTVLSDTAFGRAVGEDELPLRPILPGFIIDALLYTGIWYVFYLGLGRAKRWNRTRRGRCPNCNYDLRGNPEGTSAPGSGCPECGWGRES